MGNSFWFLLHKESKKVSSEYFDTYEKALDEWKKRFEETEYSNFTICKAVYNC